MDFNSSDLPKMCFKSAPQLGMKNVPLDGRMLQVLISMDGKKTVEQIASEIGLPMIQFREILAKLWKEGLLQCLDQSGPLLDAAFFTNLKSALVRVVGPMGEILLQDVLSDMGLTRSKAPVTKAGELIERLSEQFPDPVMGNRFRQAMLKMIMER